MTRILVIDDEKTIRFAFEHFLRDEGFQPMLAADAAEAMDQVRMQRPEIVFLDYRLPGRDGLDILREIKDTDPGITVVFMTAFGEMDVAIKAMQGGAYEYLTKPLDLDRIRDLINHILEGKKSLQLVAPPEADGLQQLDLKQIVGKGTAMQEIFKMIGLLTTQDVTVLITGESGVGKELVARAIHNNSARSSFPFVAINCGAIPINLIESELFGYEKGAFTGAIAQKPGKFEAASGGTIFLDEIGELQGLMQVKLLRVLQEQEFERIGGNKTIRTDVRIIAATNKDLQEELLLGNFRQDLFYRLHLIHLQLPPLRERKEDLPHLIEHFIRKANLEMNRQVRGITEGAMKRLESYAWPGNVRELENQIKRAMVLSREDVLPEHLFDMGNGKESKPVHDIEGKLSRVARQYFCDLLQSTDSSGSPFDQVIGAVEKTLIEEALHKTDNNQVQTARLLGMHRSTLRKKITDYQIS